MNRAPNHAGGTRPSPTMIRIVGTVFLPFAGGYFLSYLYRTVNSIIGENLRGELGLSAGDLGLLTAAYFLAFGLFQVPLGILLDRFGPRRVQAALLLSAAAGAFVFSEGNDIGMLIAGRALIGLGVAGGLMASFKAITLWFPQARWPLVNGCFLAMGGLGAVAATEPVEFALQFTDWRGVFVILSIATIAVSALIFLIVPEKETDTPPQTIGQQFRGLKVIYGDRFFWTVAPMMFLSLSSNLAIQTLWAGPWLADVAGFERATVAHYLFATAVAMTIGFVGGGMVADWFSRRGVGLLTVVIVGILLFMAIQLVIILELDRTALWPWLLFGLLANMAVLGYPLLSGHFPIEYAGRANTALNVLGFLGAFGLQYAVGEIIDLWPSPEGDRYNPDGYPVAFGALLGLQLLGFIWFLLMYRGVRSRQA